MKNLKNKIKFMVICVFVSTVLLQACASISSQKLVYKGTVASDSRKGIDDGVVYFMPKRPIRLAYEIEDGNIPGSSKITVTVDDTYVKDMVPDTQNMFLLRYNKNYVGKNHMYMSIDRNGLLSISHADTVSRLNEIIKNAAKDAAAIGLGAGWVPESKGSEQNNATGDGQLITHLGKDKDTLNYKESIPGVDASAQKVDFSISERCKPGKYSKLIEPEKIFNTGIHNHTLTLEGCTTVNITTERAFAQLASTLDSDRLNSENWFYWLYNKLDLFHMHNTGNSLPGLFYREEKPYRITIKAPEAEYQLTALSPNESGIYFAPITKTLFSANTSDIFLFKGVMQSLEQTTESELWEASKGPADFLGEYTRSLGQIFTALNTNATNENTLLKTERDLSVANATNNLLYARALADARTNDKTDAVKAQTESEKTIAESEQQAKAAQAKKQYCDELFDKANSKKDDERHKALVSYFETCGKTGGT